MATRKSSIGAQLKLDRSQFAAALKDSRRDAQTYVRSLEEMKVSRGAFAPGGGGAGAPAVGKWAEMGGKIQVAGLAMKGLQAAAAGARKVFDAEASFEKIVQQLAATADGSETLREELTSLAEVAKSPGLGYREAIQGAAAFKSMGLNAADAREALKQFGNALTNSGKGKADLEAVISALEQIAAGGMVDEGNLKEIARRIRGFRDTITGLDREKPMDWIREVVERLKSVPRAAEGAQDKLDNFKDAVDQKRLGLTGGKGAAFGGAALSELGGFLSGKGIDLGNLWDVADEGDIISKYEVSEAEISRRQEEKRRAQEAAAQARAIALEEEEAALQKVLDTMQLQHDIEKAMRAGDSKLLDVLEKRFRTETGIEGLQLSRTGSIEERLEAMREEFKIAAEVKEIAEKTGLSHKVIVDQLHEQQKTARNIAALQKEARGREFVAQTGSELEAARLRSRGKHKQADKLEADAAEAARVEQLMDASGGTLTKKAAQDIAKKERRYKEDEAYFEQTGRRKIRGAENGREYEGLDAYPRNDGTRKPLNSEWDFTALDAMKQDRAARPYPADRRAADKPAAAPAGGDWALKLLGGIDRLSEIMKRVAGAAEVSVPGPAERTKPRQ